MAVATFDMLKFANTLKAAGVPDKQAEAQAAAFAEVIQINLKDLVTKDDLAHEAADTRKEVHDVEQRLTAKIDMLAAQLRGEMAVMKWMLGVIVAGIVGILVRLFIYRSAF